MLVDVLLSGKSVFSLFCVLIKLNWLFSLHVFFCDTEDCPEEAKLKYRIPIIFSCEQLNIILIEH